MKAKVCHFTSTHGPKDQRIFYKECLSLVDDGYEVYLVEQGESSHSLGVEVVGTGEVNGGRFHRLVTRPKNVYRLAKLIDADIYHFHDMELIPYGVKLKKAGKKVIFDYHEDYASHFADSDALRGPEFFKKGLAKLYGLYESSALEKFDALISVTPHICKRLKDINPATEMVTNYPLLDAGLWGRERAYDESSGYIAFAGQISDTYKLSLITEAIQDIPNIAFKMCGPQRKNDDIAKIKAIDTNQIAEYMGILPYTAIPEFVSKSRAALVLATYGSNAGGKIGTLGNNKLFEAMLCGVPVICTDFELWKEIIQKHHCGICVDPNSEKQIAQAVKHILGNPSEAREMGLNGRKAVLAYYNWSSQKEKLLALYDNLQSHQL